MKAKMNIAVVFVGLTLLILYCPGIFGQDSLAQQSQMLDLKLQLLDSKLQLLDAKVKLWETKPQELDTRLNKLDSKIASLDFDPKKLNKKINEMDSLYKKSQRTERQIDILPKPITKEEIQFMPAYKSSIMINPVALREGTFHLSYERIINNSYSINMSGIATYSTTKGISTTYFTKQSFAYYNDMTQSYDPYTGDVMSGGGFNLQVRNYLRANYPNRQKAPLGLYAAPQFMFKNMSITGYYKERVEDTTTHQYTWENRKIVQHLNIFSGGVVLGYKIPLFKVLVVDVFASGNIQLSKYRNEDTFTKYKDWKNFDFSGVLPVVGVTIGILK